VRRWVALDWGPADGRRFKSCQPDLRKY
jgi:hypothetical protein